MKILVKLLQFLPRKGLFMFCGLLLAAEMGSVLLTPFILQSLVDGQNASSYIWLLLGCLPLIAAGSLGQSALRHRGVCQIRRILWKRYLQLPLTELREQGEIMTLMTDDVEKAVIYWQGFTVASLFRAVIFIVSSVWILASRQIQLLALALGLGVAAVLASLALTRRRQTCASRQREKMGELNQLTAELFQGREEIQAFGQEAYFHQKYQRLSANLTKISNQNHFWNGIGNAVETLIETAAQPLALVLGFSLWQGEDILLLSGYAAVLMKGLMLLTLFWGNAQHSVISGRKIEPILWGSRQAAKGGRL